MICYDSNGDAIEFIWLDGSETPVAAVDGAWHSADSVKKTSGCDAAHEPCAACEHSVHTKNDEWFYYVVESNGTGRFLIHGTRDKSVRDSLYLKIQEKINNLD